MRRVEVVTYQVNVGLAGERLARGQDVRIVACGFIGSVLALIVIRPYCLGTATPLCKPR
jgi:hypothetical protein